MVPEARLETSETGVVPKGDGWFVLNAREGRWFENAKRGRVWVFDDAKFEQVGISLYVLGPGQPMAMYHWEADQEDFLVLSGEAVLIIENEERPLKAWDFVHCPPNVSHVIVGAGDEPAVIVAVGAREHQDGPDWGAYPYSEVAMRYDASAPRDTSDPDVAYARFPKWQPTAYREGSLP